MFKASKSKSPCDFETKANFIKPIVNTKKGMFSHILDILKKQRQRLIQY
ncbi:unnamed protein product [Brassica oleracea]